MKKTSLFWGWSIWRWIISLKVCLFLGGGGRGKRSFSVPNQASPAEVNPHLPGAASRLHPPWPIPTWNRSEAAANNSRSPVSKRCGCLFRSVFSFPGFGIFEVQQDVNILSFLENHWHHGTPCISCIFFTHTRHVWANISSMTPKKPCTVRFVFITLSSPSPTIIAEDLADHFHRCASHHCQHNKKMGEITPIFWPPPKHTVSWILQSGLKFWAPLTPQKTDLGAKIWDPWRVKTGSKLHPNATSPRLSLNSERFSASDVWTGSGLAINSFSASSVKNTPNGRIESDPTIRKLCDVTLFCRLILPFGMFFFGVLPTILHKNVICFL